ncbi:MAG: hypothetical protein H5U40_09090 [Polyangiaceae bacterium]|nr:hypothetical protein [Polyangiaceae bacterium]
MRGPILPGRVFPSPARLDRSSFRVVGIEAEIAFRLDRDVGEWTGDDGRGLPMTAHAAIEVVDSRYSDLKAMSPVAVLADNFANSALVLGAALPPELVSRCPPFTLHDESGIFSSTRANHSGDPYALAMMLVLQCTARGITLPAGTWITTGSYTGLRFATGERHFSVRHGEATLVELHLHDTGEDQPE